MNDAGESPRAVIVTVTCNGNDHRVGSQGHPMGDTSSPLRKCFGCGSGLLEAKSGRIDSMLLQEPV